MTTTLTCARVLAAAAMIGLFGAASAPAFSDDGFMAIHMDNQKTNAAVATYWATFGTVQSSKEFVDVLAVASQGAAD